MNRLQCKIALVTGAASGIGVGIARAFVEEGGVVYVTDLRDEPGRSVAASLGDAARYLHLDVREEAGWIFTVDAMLAAEGRIDIVVNNAGPARDDPENTSLANWRAVLATNLDGTFLGCKHAIRAMRGRGTGSIINISSRSGLVGIPGAAAYAASKAAVRNHTKTVALYCAGQGWRIRCNSIHPGAILTPMWEPMLGAGADRDARMASPFQDNCGSGHSPAQVRNGGGGRGIGGAARFR